MSNTTPHAPTLCGVPHLGRAEAVLYVFFYYLFSYVHPRYQRYIDALAQHDRMSQFCAHADDLQALYGFNPDPKPARPIWRQTDLPDIYFTLLFAWCLVRPRPWAGLSHPAQSHQIFPTLEPD